MTSPAPGGSTRSAFSVHRASTTTLALLGVLVLTLLGAPDVRAADLLERELDPAGEESRSCIEPRAGGGVWREQVVSPVAGYLEARLSGGSGDWDLTVFSKRTGEPVAAGATSLADEVATGFALPGETLVLQVCRRPGAGGTVRVEAAVSEVSGRTPAPSLLRVQVPDDAAATALQRSGLDITHSAGPGYMDIVAYGRPDIERLARAGLSYQTRVADLTRQGLRQRRSEVEDEASRATLAAGGLPSGRSGTYRRLFDYEQELKQIAADNPKHVRLFTLPERSYEGRVIQGIEITRKPGVSNGKPAFLQMGLHHAREWPSGEHAIEWAYELLNGFKAGKKRARKTMNKLRTVVIPAINPDGFNASREAGELQLAGAGRSASNDTEELVNILTHPIEYRRKNCRYLDDSEGGSCVQPDLGLVAAGVDPNRNYGGFWGGPGASTDPTAADYRGPGPFSEPETRNVQDYMSKNMVTAFITNHTFTGLVLRPPAIQAQGHTVDEPRYRRLGKAMTDENGYANDHSYELYDTTGGTEDWAYYATGSIGYTFEIGRYAFHPAFAETVEEWNGSSRYFDAEGGNAAAYWKVSRFAMRQRNHALLRGQAPRRGKLILKKSFRTKTSPVLDSSGEAGPVQRFPDRLRYVARVRRNGKFRFHVNPSTRPVVAQSRGERGAGPASDPKSFSGGAATTTPCADYETTDPGCWNDHPILIPSEKGRSNASATVRIEWATPISDWDLRIFRDSDGNGSSAGETEEVASSGTGPGSFEQATIGGLKPGQRYVARVINYAALESYTGTVTFAPPEPFQKAKRERWTLICKNRKGKREGQRRVHVERGQVRRLDLRKGC